MTNDALKPLYIVIVDDVPYVFSNSRDAEKFTFNYKQPQKILMAHDKTRAALAPVDVKRAASAQMYYRESTGEWVLELNIVGDDINATLRWAEKTPDDLVESVDTTPSHLAPVDVEGLANYIRTIDGDNTMGAGELAERITDHLAARGVGVPDSEWFFRWIARGKAGYAGMNMEQCADIIWHSPDNPYRENNPWAEAAPKKEGV